MLHAEALAHIRRCMADHDALPPVLREWFANAVVPFSADESLRSFRAGVPADKIIRRLNRIQREILGETP